MYVRTLSVQACYVYCSGGLSSHEAGRPVKLLHGATTQSRAPDTRGPARTAHAIFLRSGERPDHIDRIDRGRRTVRLPRADPGTVHVVRARVDVELELARPC